MTTSVLPLRLGTARLGSYVEPGAEAPRRITVHGQCWELVTDPLFDIALVTEGGDSAAQEAFAARLANILHLNVGNLVVTDGAVVNELVAQRIAVAVARVIELDADRITSGQIDTARLNAAAIAVGVATVIELDADRITSGQIDTARLRAQEVAAAVASFLTLTADQITSGQIDTALLNAQEIATAVATIIELNADRITAGTLDADRIAAHSIAVGKLIVDEQLAAEIVEAMSIATKNLVVTEEAILNRATIINGLAADVIAAAKIYASQLVVAALDDEGNLVEGSVDTVQIADGAVRAAQVHAEEVAGAIGRFLTIEVGQLVAGTADIDSLVAQKIAAGTADFQEAFIQNLRSNGAVIDEAVIADLAANIITSGLFRTAESGQRLEIDSNGLIMWGIDPDGVEYEMVRLGPAGEQLLTIGGSTISEDAVASPRGAFEQLSVGGEDLLARLEAFPRGRVAQNRYLALSDYSSMVQSRLVTQFVVEPFRRYQVTLSPFYLQAQGNSGVEYQLVYSWSGLSTTWGQRVIATGRSQLPDNNPHTVSGLIADLPTSNDSGPLLLYITLLIKPSTQPVRMSGRADYPATLSVDDVGVRSGSPGADDVGSYWTYGNVDEGTGAPPAPVTPTIRRYTETWSAGGYGGDTSSGDVVQGYFSGVGMRYGGWVFPSAMRTALNGSIIEKFEVYLKNDHWYYGSGGTASIRPNNGTYKGTVFGSTQHLSPDWPRYQGRRVLLPSSWYPHFVAGTYGGVSVQTDSTSGIYYGRFNGSSTAFRVTYRK